ncbi:hypothetical protein GCM10008986_34930 [Salinibacillus aidingensis]|uniref:Uncharacterized protein n=1 Tax=Salinibacillus aidingensis TaxID=237684 RepID=A0ABP3LRH3_9BACI
MKTKKEASRTVRNSYDHVNSDISRQIHKVLDEPVMKAFLDEPTNIELLNNAIEFPTDLNCNKLDEVF